MELLDLASIYSAPDLATDVVEIPEWPDKTGAPGKIRFRQMSADRNIKMARTVDALKDATNKKYGMPILIIFGAVDENDQMLWQLPSEELPEYLPALQAACDKLMEKNFKVLNRLQKRLMKLNSLDDTGKETIKKDSSEGETAGSPSASQES